MQLKNSSNAVFYSHPLQAVIIISVHTVFITNRLDKSSALAAVAVLMHCLLNSRFLKNLIIGASVALICNLSALICAEDYVATI